MAEPKFFSAARAEIKKNGVKLATITGLRWSETISRRRVQVIGDIEATERTAVAVDVSWSADFVKTVKLDERQLGLVGGRKVQDLITEEPFSIEIKDKGQTPSKTQYTLVECVYNGGNWNLPTGDILTGAINGDGKRMLHASEK